MKIVQIYSNEKNLVDKFIERLREDFENSLSWLTASYPAARVGVRENGSKYPQCYSNNGTCEIIDLQPDNSMQSYCFFRKDRNIIAEFDTLASLEVVFWLNLKSIEKVDYDKTESYILEIIQILRAAGCVNLAVDYNNPFSIYNIDEVKNQFLMYPFTAFSISFDRNLQLC